MSWTATEATIGMLEAQDPSSRRSPVVSCEGHGQEIEGGDDEEGKGESGGVIGGIGTWEEGVVASLPVFDVAGLVQLGLLSVWAAHDGDGEAVVC